MTENPKLLVVDDDATICQACRRVFTRQGFQVEQCTDARQGLTQATKGDYAAILLDIKMPEMDGTRFLEELRLEKPSVPVILITGYPSVPSAASAVRLGASDYVTKPFTPEEITRSVQRVLPRHHAWAMLEAGAGPWLARAGESRFLDQSWLQLGGEQWVRVGAVLAHSQTATGKAVRLPGVGDVVYQGLPLAALALADDSLIVIPASLMRWTSRANHTK